MEMPLDELAESICRQVAALASVVDRAGGKMIHVKPHGALYNRAWRDPVSAEIVVRAALLIGPRTALFCPAGSAQEEVARTRGLGVVREVFIDRRYRPDGTLVPRAEGDATIATSSDLGDQLSFLEGLEFDTMCVHGDNPAALALLQALPEMLAARSWAVAAYAVPG